MATLDKAHQKKQFSPKNHIYLYVYHKGRNDEPTGSLDSQTGMEIMQLFQTLNAAGMTIVMVTHEQDIAAQAKRIITLHDGLIVA